MFCYFHPFLWLFAFPKHYPIYNQASPIYNQASSVYIKLLLYISSFFCTYQTSSVHIKLLLYIKGVRFAVSPTRPERAEAPSPGHRPGYNGSQQDAL